MMQTRRRPHARLARRAWAMLLGGGRRTRVAMAIAAIATLALADGEAFAQKKGSKPANPPAQPAGGAAAPTEIELDAPPPTETPETPPDAVGTTPPATGGICEIDPSACPKQEDIKASIGRSIAAEVYAVQQIYALRRGRLELQPYWAFTLNDQFVSHPGPGVNLNYYITNVLAAGLGFTWFGGLNVDSDFNFENRRATRVAVPLTEYREQFSVNFTYVPMYGKFAGFKEFIFHYDGYVIGGVGAIDTRPIPVIDPDNRKFDYKLKVAFNVGLGLRIFLNRWFAANLELRDYIYNEQLENTTVARSLADQQDPKTWFGENRLTNNVQAQLGISIFFPFSWEYRLPK